MGNVKRVACLGGLFLVLLMAGSACEGRKVRLGPVGPSPSPPGKADEQLFSQAEALFKARKYAQAEKVYQEYLDKYPLSAQSSAAWMQLAQISLEMQDYEKARDAYEKVRTQYADSAMANDAAWGILDTYFKEQRYDILMPELNRIASSPASPMDRFRALSLLGDAYAAWGEAQNALDSYLKAYSLSSAGEKGSLYEKMEKVLDLLTLSEAQAVLGSGQDCSTVGLMALKIARDQIKTEQWPQAKETLETLLRKCPDFPRAGEARLLLEDLKKKEGFHQGSIGCLLPLTGRYERFGNQLLSGVEMAISLYNAQHPGKGIGMVVRDTQGNANLAAKGFRELAEQGVSLVIGPMLDAESIAQPAKELGLSAIVFTQKQSVADPEGYLFRNYLTLPMQARTLVSHARSTLGLSRFAILYPNDDYGKAAMKTFWEEAIRQGGVLNGVESYNPKETDFASSIKKLVGLHGAKTGQKTGPTVDFEALFIPDAPDVAGLILPQLKFHDISGVLLMGTNLLHSPKLLEIAGEHAEGAVMTDIFFKESPDPEVVEFISLYEDTYGSSPGFLEALGFDSANLTMRLMEMPEVTDRESLRQALEQVQFHGVTGKTAFDQSHEVDKDLYLLQVYRKRFNQIPKPRDVVAVPDAGMAHERTQ